MTCQFPPLPAPAQQIRADGWSPARQRAFLETLAATGIVGAACDAAFISTRSAYALRIRRDGAAFRLGWDAAILIARARLADDLLARALTGTEEVIRKDEDAREIVRHRHDNRLAMSMLARLDRMADSPPEGSDAALARIVAQDFAAYLDMLCPQDDRTSPAAAEADRRDPPRPASDRAPRDADPATPHDPGRHGADLPDPRLPDPLLPDPLLPDPHLLDSPPVVEAAAALSPGASAALFVVARMALVHGGNARPDPFDERCELWLHPDDVEDETPEDAVAELRGIWRDSELEGWRTDYPPPPGFGGYESGEIYEIGSYERGLTPEEVEAMAARNAAERRPYEEAAARARDAYFGFAPTDAAG